MKLFNIKSDCLIYIDSRKEKYLKPWESVFFFFLFLLHSARDWTMTSSSLVYSHQKNIFFFCQCITKSFPYSFSPMPHQSCIGGDFFFFKKKKLKKMDNFIIFCLAQVASRFFLRARIQGQHLRTTSGNWRITRNKKKGPRCKTKKKLFYFPFLFK